MSRCPETMTCAEAEPLLPLVADGAIDPDSDAALFAHLASCAACQRIVASHDLISLAIAAAPRQPRRSIVLRLWPYAAAACLALAAGAWLLGRDPAPAARPAMASQAAPAAKPAPTALPAPAVAEREVIAVPRSDGGTLYLVHQGDAWIPLDPAGLDGPGSATHSGGSGVQVRY